MKEHTDDVERMLKTIDSLVEWAETRLEAIDADTSIDEGEVDQLCSLYMQVLDVEKELRELVKRFYTTTESFKVKRILDKFDSMGVDKVAVPSLGRSFYPMTRYSASMLDKPGAMSWLRENGAAELITETVNHQTLTAFIKSMIHNDGMEPPDELFKFSGHRYLGSSAYNPKK